DPAGAILLVGPRGQARLLVSPQRAVSWAGFRLGSPRRIATGEAASLRVTVTGPAGPQAVDVVPGQLTRAGDLEIGVERYFPDFVLDERQQPFSRSLEPRNPAALLQVRRGGQAWRVFVIAAMPGIHRPEGLDRSFSLLSMTPLETVEIAVAREPAAPLAGAALLLLAAAAFSSAFET